MITKNILFTCLALIATVVLFEVTTLDVWVQDHFYHFEQMQWLVDRDNKLLKFLFYDGVRQFYYSFVVLLIAALLIFRKVKTIQHYRQGLLIVCLSAVLIPAFVGMLKAITHVPCPRNITRYGGPSPYISVLSRYSRNSRPARYYRCYPAGHASGAFALLSLFYLFKKRRNKLIAVALVLSGGCSTGAYKMLIGDHFLSHTIVSMLLACLLVQLIAGGMALLMAPAERSRTSG